MKKNKLALDGFSVLIFFIVLVFLIIICLGKLFYIEPDQDTLMKQCLQRYYSYEYCKGQYGG